MPEQLEGTVERIRFHNDQTFWTVASVKVAGGAMPVPLVGTLPGLTEGMQIRAEGGWVDDRRFGRQFRAERYTELVPATSHGLKAYLASGFIDGIGPKLAQRIVDHFGEETLDVIAASPARLAEVEGLGVKRSQQIVEAFRERRGAQEALVFLYGLGITPGLANKVYQKYGDRTVALVRQNPYRLAEDVHGVGFKKADDVARGMDIGHDDPARIRAGVYHVLLEARGEGHCYLPRTQLVTNAAALLGLPEPDATGGITPLAMERKIVLEELTGSSDDAVFLASLHDAEVRLSGHLLRLLHTAPGDPGDIDRRLAGATAHLGFELAPGQSEAVKLALTRGTAVITGGPGTGKTTIIKALLAASGLEKKDVALAAPTGRAAKRMSEATGHEAKTIHRLLQYSPQEGFQRNEDDPLDVALVIIDEASMLDVGLCHALVRAIPDGTGLVLVGDVDQLPPVGAGSPFTDIIDSGQVPVARLTHIYRQGAGSAIVRNAHAVNSGVVPKPTGPGTPEQDFYFIERDDPQPILETIEHLVTERMPKAFGLDAIDDIQVLSPMRNGLIGIESLNRRLQELLNPTGEELQVGATTLRTGDKVMQIRNDYDRGVFNGDMGRIHHIARRERKVVVDVEGRPVEYKRDELDQLVLAYAVSVHKSQGSEYPAVVMPVSTQHYIMLQRNLIYTGITRGKRLVVLVGQRRAMERAVRNADVARRYTRLVDRLRGAVAGDGHGLGGLI